MIGRLVLCCLIFVSVILNAQPLAQVAYPPWLRVTLIADQLEINGLTQTLYAYHSKQSEQQTHRFFASMLAQHAHSEFKDVHRADNDEVHTQSIFVPPFFITVTHQTATAPHSGHISVLDFTQTNASWGSLDSDLPQQGLTLLQRTRGSETDDYVTSLFRANASATETSNHLMRQFLNAGWTALELHQDDAAECLLFDWVKQASSVLVSVCPAGGTEADVVMVRTSI